MMKVLHFGVILLVLSFTGCPTDNKDGDNGGGDNGIDYTNYASPNYSIRVKNDTNKKLVAFKGTVSTGTLISGIPINAANHGLKKDPALFSTTGDFVLVLVTEAQYNANKDNLSVLNDQSFARLYAFYAYEGTNEIVYSISASLGGDGKLTVQNQTSYDVELRRGGPYGESIGFIPANFYSVIRLNSPGDYIIFPVLKKYSALIQEICTLIPRYTDGVLAGQPCFQQFSFAPGQLEYTLNVMSMIQDATIQDATLTTGGTFLMVANNSQVGVQLNNGAETLLTSAGVSTINPNGVYLFTLPFIQSPDGTYPALQTFGQLSIGTVANQLPVPSQEYKSDYIYMIEVTGTNASDLQLEAVVAVGAFAP